MRSASRATLALLVVLLVPVVRAGERVPLATEKVVGGLVDPVFVTSLRNDSRLFVLEQSTARIRIVQDGAILPTPFLDLAALSSNGGENGLLGMAFGPDYATTRRFYVFYNDNAGDTRLVRYRTSASDPNVADPASAEVLIVMDQPFPQHNGGSLALGRDRMLYVSTGDGGSGGDPFNNAQRLDSLLGKILRIDVKTPTGYAIPSDNPFVGVPGARGEIWHLGLRNPWRTSIDSVTGDLYIGDVGGGTWEELDFVAYGEPGGQNFGWRCMEGSFCNTVWPDCDCDAPEFRAPLLQYDHNVGCAVIDGGTYRGQAMPALKGTHFYGDYCTGRVWSFRVEGGVAVEHSDRTTELSPPGGTLGFISSFGVDGNGEILVVSWLSGDIYRIVPAPDVADCDGDGTPDDEEIAAGSSFDVNANGVPDDCELELTSSPLVGGETCTLQFLGIEPGEPAAFFATARGIGAGPCFYDGALCLDIKPMNLPGGPDVVLLGATLADAQGVATLAFPMPVGVPGVEQVSFQAITLSGPLLSVKSNVEQKVYEPGL